MTLFALHPLDPHPTGTGKRLYFLCDVAFARLVGASLERQIHTWTLQEQLSQRAYRDDRATKLFYYRTPKGKIIHLLVESGKELAAMKILSEERIKDQDFEILRAYRAKNSDLKPKLYALCSQRLQLKDDKIEMYPWEAMG